MTQTPWWADPPATSEDLAHPTLDVAGDESGDPFAAPLAGQGGDEPSRPRRRRRPGSPVVVAALVAGLVGSAIGAGAVVAYDHTDAGRSAAVRDPGATISQTGDRPAPAAARPSGSVASVAAAVLPSVVTIEASSSTGKGTGSGVVLRADGYILTNDHVVADVGTGGTLTVIRNGKTSADAVTARVVGTDPTTDLAVIKAESGTWTPATLGRSSELVVGDGVVAVGAPLGLRGTVTAGIVSALNRFVDLETAVYDRAIQTDAAINPGNSGGALVNSAGAVIGINSAIATAPGGGGASGNIGVGFAIPIDEAAPIAEDIIRTGKASHPYLGVVTDDSTDPPGAVITSKTDPSTGRPVTPVGAGTPADKAGLREGDVITKVDDVAVTDYGSLIAAIRRHRAGDTVTVTYVRGGSTKTATATLAERPDTGK